MFKRFKIALAACVGLISIVGLVALVVVVSMRRVPAFYQVALDQDVEVQSVASDECLRLAAGLASDLQRTGRWQATFTAEQINGFLAVDLAKNYPDALPPEMDNPRIEIQSEQATLACGYTQGGQATVISISFDLFLSAPNVAALRVHSVRAGALPVPLSSVLEAITKAARSCDLNIQWRQSHGDPVALVMLPDASDERGRALRLDAIELRDGAIYLAGETIPSRNNELARRELLPIADDPVADEPVGESPAADDSMSERPVAADAAADDTSAEPESATDEPAAEPGDTMSAADEPAEMPDQVELEAATNENLQR